LDGSGACEAHFAHAAQKLRVKSELGKRQGNPPMRIPAVCRVGNGGLPAGLRSQAAALAARGAGRVSQSRRKGKSAEAYHSLMTRALVVLAASLGLLACGRPPAAPAAATALPSPAPAAAPAAYAPDLGELML